MEIVSLIGIQEKNFMNASLKMWQDHFKRIYGEKNEHMRTEDIWANVIENAGKVAENLRRYKYAAAFQSLAHVACWVFGFATKVQKNMDDVVWAKYPYICPYCRKEVENVVRPCSCGTVRVQLEEAKSHVKETLIQSKMLEYYAKAFKDKKPSSLDDWVSMFGELYMNVTYSTPIEHIGFHLMEEIGEVSRVLRKRREFEERIAEGLEAGTDIEMARQQFESDMNMELADVFSWICTLVYKIQSIAKALEDYQDDLKSMKSGSGTIRIQRSHTMSTNIEFRMPEATFSSVLYWEYGDGCPNCHMIPCAENCSLRECKLMTLDGKCGFDWTGKNKCLYGKSLDQSRKCGMRT